MSLFKKYLETAQITPELTRSGTSLQRKEYSPQFTVYTLDEAREKAKEIIEAGKQKGASTNDIRKELMSDPKISLSQANKTLYKELIDLIG